MALIEMKVKHNRSQDEARRVLEKTVNDVRGRFGGMIDRCEWSADRNSVHLSGIGCTADLRVDPTEVHVSADLPFLSGLLAAPFVSGFKQIIDRNFQALPAPKE
jgi:hypothetical protein